MNEFTITPELVASPDEHWLVAHKAIAYDEDLLPVETTQILTGEQAFALKATQIIASYQAYLENRKQQRISLAQKLLGMEVN